MSNADIARRWFEEVWNHRSADTVRELIGPSSVCDGEGGEMRGPDAFLTQVHAPLLAAFPDLRIDVEGTISEGDEVVVRWRARGFQSGEGLGPAPIHRHVTFRGMTWIRFANGRMAEGQDCWNLTALQQALQTGQTVASVVVE